ncbi:NADH-quinone oxidoreductase subunit D [Moorella sp. E308F]|jgi:NADH-quinone oxidoreductase subunit D|uniref:NADH-quinone oxidoreductase subunit D n=1 Tax=Moorella sp. E308F TaxID=2572682 RepID=UPI0010FFBC7E|nr:NADH-quinone oxidoreductase subunit D [Moorella sp. E308F]GEA15160.1 NADH-quinone oxidoreductase subunit D [Moorella sp. E308F]
MAVAREDLQTQEIELNMGPQHPSTHGVYRALLTLDGEKVVKVENIIGYLHRGIEKLAEDRTYTQIIPYTDRLDYLAGMLNNLGYVQTVEKLMGIEVPERAEYLRIIMAELSRIASHLIMVASMALDVSGWTAWFPPFRERERILDLFEMTCGSRLTVSYMRIGGVAADIPPGFLPALEAFLDDLPQLIAEVNGLITGNEIFKARCRGVGRIDLETALAYGITGPNLRACGLPFDLRKARPYGIYDRFEFDIPTLNNGDSYDRFVIRLLEMEQSARIIRQAMAGLPEGPVMAKVPRVIKPPRGEVYHQIEGAKGILGFYLVSDGGNKPYRLHIHSPSFVNLGSLPKIAEGGNIQDFVVNLASIDIVLGEVDR